MDHSYAEERQRMVNEDLIPRGISDSRVLAALGKIQREKFVPRFLKDMAYQDRPLVIGMEQTISQPYIVSLMSEALELQGDEKVLEIGTGSGYQAALLAELSREVYTVERLAPLQKRAKQILDELGYNNVHFKIADEKMGWPEHSPYDAIMVTARAPKVPDEIIRQLRMGGKLLIPVGDAIQQELIRLTRGRERDIIDNFGFVRFVPLIGGKFQRGTG
jgi:protein-L-isoaspartate(D-aspartate) O-methyltransferase